jgi:hypothetical protein
MTRKNKIQIYLVLVVVTGFLLYSSGCKQMKLEDPELYNLGDLIKILAHSDSVQANGVDRIKISAELSVDTPDGKKIVFTTDHGTFAGIPAGGSTSNNKQQAEITAIGRIAEVELVSSIEVIEKVTVSASVEDYADTTEVEFTRAYPDRIFITTNVTRLLADGQNTATLTANLVPPENKGKVSNGARVIFDAIDKNTGAAVPHLHREALSDAGGKAIASFVSQQPGVMEISCRVEGLADKVATITIEFYEEKEDDES